MGIKNGTAILQDSLAVFHKAKDRPMKDSTITFPVIYPNDLKTCLHKNLNVDVYTSFIPICQTLEVIKVSFKGSMDKSSVVHPGNRIFSSNKKK